MSTPVRMLARKHPVHRHGGIWWVQVRKRFCWPLDPFVTLPPRGCRPAWHCSVAGYHFLVEKPAEANSWFNPMLLEDVSTYGLERMDSSAATWYARASRPVSSAL